MIGSFLISNEVVVENVSRKKQVYRFCFDLEQIPEDELAWLLKQYKVLRRLARQGKADSDTIRGFALEVEKIVSKGYGGHRGKMLNPLLLDPAYRPATHHIAHTYSHKDVGLWWCDAGTRGKKFTSSLCTNPSLDIDARGRRAVALNPWDLGSLGDLDTIIDSYGEHKSGTIGKFPFSFTRTLFPDSTNIMVTFVASSTTTINSILFLIATYYGYRFPKKCHSEAPAPKGTCHKDYYCSVYLPLWGWDVSFSIVKEDVYSVKIRFYI